MTQYKGSYNLLSLLLLFWITLPSVFAQDEVVKPVNYNSVIKGFLAENPNYEWKPASQNHQGVFFKKRLDSLPFFDDFSTSGIYPDTNKWLNNAVYINNHFPLAPPSAGVATFDALDSRGNPYNISEGDPTGSADTLLSSELDFTAYTPADSIYISFWFQGKGRADDGLGPRDSLVLHFRDNTLRWQTVWKVAAQPLGPFQMVMIPIRDLAYFHDKFQFRFMNFGGLTGNLNHWHVDYILLDRNRSITQRNRGDVTVMDASNTMLQNYTSVPLKQFRQNPSKYIAANHELRIRNLDSTSEQIKYEYYALDDSFNQLAVDSSRTPNLEYLDTVVKKFNTVPPFATLDLSGDSLTVYNRYRISKSSPDPAKLNDTLLTRQDFRNYFAYDDGSAESGWGINHTNSGEVAYRFELDTPDVLYGVDIFFNQSEEDVSQQGFNLLIWQQISPVGQLPASDDVILYEQFIDSPAYTNKINGFTTIRLDTPQNISGVFYVGWRQFGAFNLNIGMDKNYPRNGSPAVNPNLFFKTAGFWRAPLQQGALMIRPLVGYIASPVVGIADTKHINTLQTKVYPNPAQDRIFIELLDSRYTNLSYSITDLTGKTVLSGAYQDQGIDTSVLPAGLYLVRVTDNSTFATGTKKIIITR